MCLRIAHRNLKTIPTHKEGEPSKDKKVYKILLFDGKTYVSPFTVPFEWTFDEIITDQQEPDIKTFKDRGTRYRIVGKGFFHAYSSILAATAKMRSLLSDKVTQKYLTRTGKSLVLKEALIPEGTKYYEGTRGDICAKSLKILNKDVPILETENTTGV